MQLSAHLADGESVVTHTDCAPLGSEPPGEDVQRTAVLTDRSLYYVVGTPRGGDQQVVSLPLARMQQVARQGLALLSFTIDDAPVTWELRSPTFAARAERQFRVHELQTHREWVGGREPAGFMYRAHHDLLARMSAGVAYHDAVAAQHEYVAGVVYADTQNRAAARAAARRLRRVHTLLFAELQQLQAALPTAPAAQHAQALAAKPAPWPEDGVPADDGGPLDDGAPAGQAAADSPADRQGSPVG